MTKLLTEKLEEQFGPIEIFITKQNDNLRLSHLVDKDNVTRTFAITKFQKDLPKCLESANKLIKDGNAIGKTLKNNGFNISKDYFYVSAIEIPKWLMVSFNLPKINAIYLPRYALSKSYDLYVGKSQEHFKYATITEIYSPDFINPWSVVEQIWKNRETVRSILPKYPNCVVCNDGSNFYCRF